MTIINLVTSVDKINFGIWNAAVFGSSYLANKYGIVSHLWVTGNKTENSLAPPVNTFFLQKENLSPKAFVEFLQTKYPEKTRIIIVTHGCWRQPTLLGNAAAKNGYNWVYVPHGMLEPWSMQHRKWKKLFYFQLFEKRMASSANIIRAVGSNEQSNLSKLLNRKIILVENGVKVPQNFRLKDEELNTFLFMARLHFKKGITPLVKAWHLAMKNTNAKLIIAGPDEGELQLIQPYLCDNIIYVGAVYGDEKIKLLQQANYYVLPSLSEGFPVSVLEAMSYGCIPLISEGCNFNAVFEKKLGFKIEPNEENIVSVLQQVQQKKYDYGLSKKNSDFIASNYSEEHIGEQLFTMYKN